MITRRVVVAGVLSLTALSLPAAGTGAAASPAEKPRTTVAGVLALASLALSPAGSGAAAATAAGSSRTTVVTYDNFEKPGGYTLADYFQKWSNKFGPAEMAVKETRSFEGGVFSVEAVPFQTAHDFSVLDHVKYFATSTETFRVPRRGSVEFSADMTAETPGIQPGHVIHGTYGPPYSYPTGKPYEATLLEGQQAAKRDTANGRTFQTKPFRKLADIVDQIT